MSFALSIERFSCVILLVDTYSIVPAFKETVQGRSSFAQEQCNRAIKNWRLTCETPVFYCSITTLEALPGTPGSAILSHVTIDEIIKHR